DKSTSTTFALLNRPQNDPKIHDASSSSMVFQELAPSQAHKIKSRRDLEVDLFTDADNTGHFPAIRDNEGEAAEYGIYYDDTDYDYMQHMRDLGSGTGDGQSYFVEAPVKKQAKGKAKLRLEDALKEASLEDSINNSSSNGDGKPQPLFREDVLPSTSLKQTSYQDQQDVPDVLAGFQPDMDPRLREVLEALDDEAYVDDKDDVFGEIARDREEVSLTEFEEQGFVEDQDFMDDDGWETDGTEKPPKEFSSGSSMPPQVNTEDVTMADGPDHGDGDWMKEFSKFKKDHKAQAARPRVSNADLDSSIMNDSSMTGGRRKKRKGAMTSSTGYSMTSSSLLRTEGQTLLDARFDQIEEDYAEDAMDDDGGVSIVSGLTGASAASSQAPSLASRSDFEGMMDDFLGSYSMSGKKRVKKGGPQTGMDQLDEIRKGLGPARVKSQKA
ncbi:MAG: hypothetical protein Q9191_006648, partial [Dirinaria sp. TL-2023a]